MTLKELLGEELYKQVKDQLDEAEDDVKLIINDGSYVPRERLNDKNDKIELLEQQIEERDNQIDQLKNDTQTTEELKQKIEELQKENEKTEKEMKEKLEQQKLDSAVELAVTKAKARNPKAVKALLDMDKVELTDDGEVKGLDDQLEKLQEEEDYLFKTDDGGSDKGGSDFGGGNETPEKNPWQKGNINLQQQAKIINDNPSLAQKLMKEAGVDPEKRKRYLRR